MEYLHGAQNEQHAEPHQHDGSEREANHLGAKSLEEEQQRDDPDHDAHRQVVSGCDDVRECMHPSQSLDSTADRDGWLDNTIGQKRGSAKNGWDVYPLAVAAHQGVKREHATFTPVVCLKREVDVLEGGLQRQRPDDAADAAIDELLTDQVPMHDGLEYIERACSDITEHNSQRYQHARHRTRV